MLSMKEEKVNQHIVPQRYLRRFAEEKNKKYIIGTCIVEKAEDNKTKEKTFTSNISRVGYGKGIYDVTDKENKKHWEDYFGKEIDSLYGDALEKIIATIESSNYGTKVLTAKDKDNLSKMIIAQIMRVPENINHIKDVFKGFPYKNVEGSLIMFTKDYVKDYKYKSDYVKYDEQELKNLYLDFMFSPAFDEYCGIIQNYEWRVYYNIFDEDCRFITSDNPVLISNTNNDKIGLFKNGLESLNTCIFYPLSPTIALGLYQKNDSKDVLEGKNDCKKVMLSDKKFIVQKNILISLQAHKHTFLPGKLYDKVKNNGMRSLVQS